MDKLKTFAPRIEAENNIMDEWPSKMNLAVTEQEYLFGKVKQDPEQDKKEIAKYDLISSYAQIYGKKIAQENYQLTVEENKIAVTMNSMIFEDKNINSLLESYLFACGCAGMNRWQDTIVLPGYNDDNSEGKNYVFQNLIYGGRVLVKDKKDEGTKLAHNCYTKISEKLEQNLIKVGSKLTDEEYDKFIDLSDSVKETFSIIASAKREYQGYYAVPYKGYFGFMNENYPEYNTVARRYYCSAVTKKIKEMQKKLNNERSLSLSSNSIDLV